MLCRRVSLDELHPALGGGAPETGLDIYCRGRTGLLADDGARWAVLILPGGGYERIAPAEGEPVALAFLAAGIQAFVLSYSVLPALWPRQFLEGAAALAWMRANAPELGFRPDQVAVCGFSAGGHLAGCLAGGYAEPLLNERLGLTPEQVRPDAAILGYPVVHEALYLEPLGGAEVLRPDRRVGPGHPPAFLWATVGDATVPVENTLDYAHALRARQVPFELHLFQDGPHAMGLAERKRMMEQKVVLITGGSRGIGAATARRFAAGGCKVVINYHRSQAQAEALAAEIGGWAVQADVADPVQVGRMVDNVLDKYCQLDILICNAGIAQQKLFGDLTDDDWRRMFAVNVDGVFHAVRAALPHFIHRKAGRIVTVSSMWGQVGGSCEVAYSAAKAAVIGLTRALAKELGPSGITVNCVSPGVISTEMNAHLDREALAALAEETPLGAIGTPEDVAEAIWYLSSDAARFVTGQVLAPNGGLVI